MVTITNNIITDLKNKFPKVDVLREYPLSDYKFPCIIVTEGNLPVDLATMDSGGYHYNNFEVTLDIYTTGTGRISESARLRNDINEILGNGYGLQRIFSDTIPNMGDLNVYRYRMTFVCKLDKNKTIYRR